MTGTSGKSDAPVAKVACLGLGNIHPAATDQLAWRAGVGGITHKEVPVPRNSRPRSSIYAMNGKPQALHKSCMYCQKRGPFSSIGTTRCAAPSSLSAYITMYTTW